MMEIEIYALGGCVVLLLILCLRATIHAFNECDCTIRGKRR